MNHNPKKIEERKMNLQRFLKEILAKEVIIEKGKIVLAKLGLPIDLYALPDKYKEIGDQLKKSSFSQKSQHKSKGSFRNRARGISNFAECRPQGQACNRLSLFRSSMVAVEPN